MDNVFVARSQPRPYQRSRFSWTLALKPLQWFSVDRNYLNISHTGRRDPLDPRAIMLASNFIPFPSLAVSRTTIIPCCPSTAVFSNFQIILKLYSLSNCLMPIEYWFKPRRKYTVFAKDHGGSFRVQQWLINEGAGPNYSHNRSIVQSSSRNLASLDYAEISALLDERTQRLSAI